MVSTPLHALIGERTVPSVASENYWFRRHEMAYAAVPGLVSRLPRVVLDAGSGEGYGVAALGDAWPGALVVGVDYDMAAAAHARAAHGGRDRQVVRAALTSLPLADDSVDACVSLQVLEHIWTPHELLRELVRVTRPGGSVVLTTPNRLTFSPGLGRGAKPANIHHHCEYDAEELLDGLTRWTSLPASRIRLLGIHHAGRLDAWEQRHGSLVGAQLAAPVESWDDQLRAVVAGVTAGDFAVEGDSTAYPIGASLDLVAVLVLP